MNISSNGAKTYKINEYWVFEGAGISVLCNCCSHGNMVLGISNGKITLERSCMRCGKMVPKNIKNFLLLKGFLKLL